MYTSVKFLDFKNYDEYGQFIWKNALTAINYEFIRYVPFYPKINSVRIIDSYPEEYYYDKFGWYIFIGGIFYACLWEGSAAYL